MQRIAKTGVNANGDMRKFSDDFQMDVSGVKDLYEHPYIVQGRVDFTVPDCALSGMLTWLKCIVICVIISYFTHWQIRQLSYPSFRYWLYTDHQLQVAFPRWASIVRASYWGERMDRPPSCQWVWSGITYGQHTLKTSQYALPCHLLHEAHVCLGIIQQKPCNLFPRARRWFTFDTQLTGLTWCILSVASNQ